MRIRKFKKMKSIVVVLSVLLLMVIAGCNKSSQDMIIGKWRAAYDPSAIEFKKDGTWNNLGGHASGKYKFIDAYTIEIEFYELRTYTIIELTKTDLKLKYEKTGEINPFKRIE
jgi:hypothetical protein